MQAVQIEAQPQIFRGEGVVKLFGRREASDTEAQRQQDLQARMAAISRSQAVIEFDLDGQVLAANENFYRTMGYAEGEVVGQRHRMFVPEALANSKAYGDFWEELRAGRFVAGKFERIAKGGRQVWLQATYNPVLDPDGRPYRVVKFAVDITAEEAAAALKEQERAQSEQSLSELVQVLAGCLQQLSSGDLTSTIEARLAPTYEQVKRDYNGAVGSLRDALEAVLAATGALRSGAEEISRATDDLSRRTEQQAASLEETAAALDEITATVKRSSEGAKEAAAAASEARVEAERSGVVVHDAVQAMSAIEGSAQQISQIIGVIDEIAFQTNLLALNAGVEAARAGDAGRGFAVVASEVRALAQRSAEAAKEIKTLISTSSDQVSRGVVLVDQTGSALDAILQKVSRIDGLVSEIALSAQEQATGLAQVNTAVNQMDQVTQQNAAMVEEATAASAGLKAETEELARLMGRFRTGGQAPADANPVAHAQARVRAFARSL
jgi:methyl-accepting chemotaxis protein